MSRCLSAMVEPLVTVTESKLQAVGLLQYSLCRVLIKFYFEFISRKQTRGK